MIIPSEEVVSYERLFRDVPIEIVKPTILANLAKVPSRDFEIILEMDWLTKYKA